MANTELGSQNEGNRFSRRSFLRGAAGAGVAIAAEPVLSKLSLVFAEGDPGQTAAAETSDLEQTPDILAATPEGQIVPVQLPPTVELPATRAPYHEPPLFAVSAHSPVDIGGYEGWQALQIYQKPFDAAKIGVTTDQELAKLPELKTAKKSTKDNYTIYDLPLPKSTEDELKRTYIKRNSNEIVTRDGKVFMKRVVGLVPSTNKRVRLIDYQAVLNRFPNEESMGQSAWGGYILNEYFLQDGLVLVDTMEGDVSEFVVYDPRKPDGSIMSKEEFDQEYAKIFGPEFNYDNPNVAQPGK